MMLSHAVVSACGSAVGCSPPIQSVKFHIAYYGGRIGVVGIIRGIRAGILGRHDSNYHPAGGQRIGRRFFAG